MHHPITRPSEISKYIWGSWIKTARSPVLKYIYNRSDGMYGCVTAELKTRDGDYRPIAASVRLYGAYTNDNGALRHVECAGYRCPGGSWISTARNVSLDGDVLSAELQRRDGTWRFDQALRYRDLEYENEDGRFVAVR